MAKKREIVEIITGDNKTIVQEKHIKSYTLYFKNINTLSDISYSKDDRDLIISYDNTKVTVKDYFSKDGKSVTSKVTTLRYNDGNYFNEASILDGLRISSNWLEFAPNRKGLVKGTVFSDVIDMKNSLQSPLNKKNKGLTINAGVGNDVITGTKFDDVIIGGAGINTYNYDFGAISGADTIKLSRNEELNLNLTNGDDVLTLSEVSFGKYGNNLIIYQINGSEKSSNQITIQNFFKASVPVLVGGIDLRDYLNSDDAPSLSIFGKKKIVGTNENELIFGSSGNDTITGKGGDDVIYTNGGKDTVVLTGEYGHDIINSANTAKVNVKLGSFDANNLSIDGNDLKYKTDDKSDFVYTDFMSPEKSADLWVTVNKKSNHIINVNKENEIDLSVNKNNNVVFLTGENQSYVGAKNTKGSNIVYSLDTNNYYTYQGGRETYVDYNETEDSYFATISKKGSLVIDDKGGVDKLTLNNNSKDLLLYFNVDVNKGYGNTSDLLIYNKSAMTADNIAKGIKTGNFIGSVDIKNYFDNGYIEEFNAQALALDVEGWKNYVAGEVERYLTDSNFTTTNEIFLIGNKSQKKSLLNLLKSNTYQKFLEVKSECISQDLWEFVKEDNDIKIIKDGEVIGKKSMSSSVLERSYYALNEDGVLQKYVIGTEDAPIIVNVDSNGVAECSDLSDFVVADDTENINLRKGNDKVVFNDSSNDKVIVTADGSYDTFVFNDKSYEDFYTKVSADVSYNSGDPLIRKDGNDLKIDNITVEGVDGYNSEIQLVDKNGKTKNIIIGSGKVEGTFESEIIVGSNSNDVVYSNGGNDLIYLGDGNDKIYFTAQEKGEETGKNTAEMIGIGGTKPISNDLNIPAISVYSQSGDDTYNFSLKDFGVYIEDYAGNDTLNLTYTDDRLMYIFDVVNPKHALENPTLYNDLMICDNLQFQRAAMGNLSSASGGFKGLMESLQGSFGYAWIDDYFSDSQKIENVNVVDESGVVTNQLNFDYKDNTSNIYSTYNTIAQWLAMPSSLFGAPSQDYATAWDVIEGGNTQDIGQLMFFYMTKQG